MIMTPEEEPISDVLCVCESHGQVYFLVITYYAADPGKAAGYLFKRTVGTSERASNILATNDTLRTLWCSPSGDLWLTSTTGLVWSTANLPWPQNVSEPDLEFEVPEGDLAWRHIALPAQAHNDLPPNATAIWGTSNDDVYVGSFGGVVYHWDGTGWGQYFSSIGESIGMIRGTDADNVYAIGYGSTILHFDGANWRIVGDPDGASTNDTLTGIVFTGSVNALICGKSRGGRLLRGNASGFTVVGRYGLPFIGVARVHDRIVFAAGKGGVAELTDAGVVVLRDDLIPWSVAEGENHLYFTETPGKAGYSELNLISGQWRRLSY
jgi:hypothetical protein